MEKKQIRGARKYYIVRAGIVKVRYGGVCIICKKDEVFELGIAEGIFKTLSDEGPPVVECIDRSPTKHQAMIFASKLTDALMLSSQPKIGKSHILKAKKKIEKLGAIATYTLIAQFLGIRRETVGRKLKERT